MSKNGEPGYWKNSNYGETSDLPPKSKSPPLKRETDNWTGFNYDHILNGPMLDIVYEYKGELNHIRIPYDPLILFGDLKDKIRNHVT